MSRTSIDLGNTQATKLDLPEELQDVATWRKAWREAVAETAGIAPHLEDGAEYVDSLRRSEAERRE
jgi:hypothetical protein